VAAEKRHTHAIGVRLFLACFLKARCCLTPANRLRGSRIGDEGAKLLLQALGRDSSLVYLKYITSFCLLSFPAFFCSSCESVSTKRACVLHLFIQKFINSLLQPPQQQHHYHRSRSSRISLPRKPRDRAG
jgi:hypothetical protein